ncbi:MFS transporter [Streptomyces sp. 150FB]|uniref:MFS transporter n=1 Tax=Streptomyces sp. 150FB TaxID=1576605 RepID=UPI0007C8799D|nr:MFS transporter [Streptomyces sp. 150FB]
MRKWGPLVAVCLGTFMLLLDVTIVIVALPGMATGLDASLSGLQWVIDIYALVLAALLLGAGAAADVVGPRRMYAVGTGLFALASLGCGLASTTGELIALRGVQGIGAAAMFATTLSLLASSYQGRDRSFALGIWGAVSGAAAALGPVLGGVLTEGLGWRWIFFINLPVSVAAIWMTLRAVPASRRDSTRRIDWAGTAFFALFAGGLTFGVVRAGSEGWTSTQADVAFVVALLALAAFITTELRSARPLIDLRLFRGASFVAVMVAALCFNAAAFGVLPYTSIWLQTLLGMSPVRGGLALLPLAIMSFVVAALSGRLLHGARPGLVIGIGMLFIGGGAFAMATLDAGSGWTSLIVGLALVGVGVGLVSPGIAGAALASVPPRDAGMAGGAVNTFRQLGFALGVAVFGTVATSRITDSLSGATADPKGAAHVLAGGGAGALRSAVPEGALHTAFASGLNGAALVAGAAGVLAGVVVLVWVRGPGAGARGPEAASQVRTTVPVPAEHG